ncbi:UbiD family decarboxylase [Pseudorhodoplanes sp.]|uniref:UbiD family decarboxylase n=1 Tax=Pseudorhodoplanes sp. TaxID=1934341 RepID=UPI003D10EA6A
MLQTSHPVAFQSLRDLLDRLEAIGGLQRVKKKVDKDWEIACVTRQVMSLPPEKRYALLFENVDGFATPVATNTLGASRSLYAVALGVASRNGQIDKEAIHSKWVKALANPIAPVVVKGGPCKQSIMRGADIDLLKFPVPTWTPGQDAGAYLSAGSVIQVDPETGVQNSGVYRGMIKGRNRIGVLVQPAKHSGVIMQKYEAANKPMPVAIVIGPPPYLGMTSVGRVPYGIDEINVAGALAGQPIEVTKCETLDLMVPAHSEMVIEGIVQPGFRETEGPFGEFYGHMGPAAQSPIIDVTAITYRDGTIHQGFQEQMPPSEGSCIKDIAMESILLAGLRGCGIPGVLDVYVHPMSCQSHVVVRIKPQFPSHAKAVFSGCWAVYPNRAKQVIVVEDDCDIYDDNDVQWHVATRVQPDRDYTIWEKGTGLPLDPSMPKEQAVYSGKVGIDATRKHHYPARSLPPLQMLQDVKAMWSQYGLPPLLN